MQALFITGPGETTLGQIPIPSIASGQVLLRTRIVGMCGSDLNTFRGKNPMVTYPRIPGHEIAATIQEIGAGVPPQVHSGMDVTASPFADTQVIAADVDDQKLAIARQAGAAHIIHSKRQTLHDELAALPNGLGLDVVVEAIGLPEPFRLAIEEVAFTGRVVYVGYAKDLVTYETKLFVQKELDILGSRNALDEFPTVIAMLQQKKFPVEKIISRTTSLDA